MRSGYPVICPVCNWSGDSLDAVEFRYEDDADGPYCPKCWEEGAGKKIYCEDEPKATGEKDE